MSKCNNGKKPCKICLQTVSKKNGLQCQGACQKWVHYACLNYTPGKIKDIKAGIIKVTCPCPDCKTTAPKEYRTDEPFSCTNTQCPSHFVPMCINEKCASHQKFSPPNKPLKYCAESSCRRYVMEDSGSSNQMIGHASAPPAQNRQPYKSPPKPQTAQHSCCSSPTTANEPKVYQTCQSSEHVAGDSQRGNNNMPSMDVVEQMCNTVEQLANQINDLMNKMKQAVKDNQPGEQCLPKQTKEAGCERKPKNTCPNPCFCPQNQQK